MIASELGDPDWRRRDCRSVLLGALGSSAQLRHRKTLRERTATMATRAEATVIMDTHTERGSEESGTLHVVLLACQPLLACVVLLLLNVGLTRTRVVGSRTSDQIRSTAKARELGSRGDRFVLHFRMIYALTRAPLAKRHIAPRAEQMC